MSIRWNLLRKARWQVFLSSQNGLYVLIFSAFAINVAEGEGGAGANPGTLTHEILGGPIREGDPDHSTQAFGKKPAPLPN